MPPPPPPGHMTLARDYIIVRREIRSHYRLRKYSRPPRPPKYSGGGEGPATHLPRAGRSRSRFPRPGSPAPSSILSLSSREEEKIPLEGVFRETFRARFSRDTRRGWAGGRRGGIRGGRGGGAVVRKKKRAARGSENWSRRCRVFLQSGGDDRVSRGLHVRFEPESVGAWSETERGGSLVGAGIGGRGGGRAGAIGALCGLGLSGLL